METNIKMSTSSEVAADAAVEYPCGKLLRWCVASLYEALREQAAALPLMRVDLYAEINAVALVFRVGLRRSQTVMMVQATADSPVVLQAMLTHARELRHETMLALLKEFYCLVPKYSLSLSPNETLMVTTGIAEASLAAGPEGIARGLDLMVELAQLASRLNAEFAMPGTVRATAKVQPEERLH
ncbi:hypothetical protein [Geopseudomonas aromaticivorans]